MGTLVFSQRFGSQADRLMSASMWCLGKDVQHESGNLLVRFGLRRVPRPSGHPGTSSYVAQLSPGAQIWLWGFGVIVKTPGVSCLFERDSFSPRLFDESRPLESVFDLQGLGILRRVQSESDARMSFSARATWWGWLEGYEAWLEDSLGPAYRIGLLKECRLPRGYEGSSLTQLWRHWAHCEWGNPPPFPN